MLSIWKHLKRETHLNHHRVTFLMLDRYAEVARAILRFYSWHRVWPSAFTSEISFGTLNIHWPDDTETAHETWLELQARGINGTQRLLGLNISAGLTGAEPDALHDVEGFITAGDWLGGFIPLGTKDATSLMVTAVLLGTVAAIVVSYFSWSRLNIVR